MTKKEATKTKNKIRLWCVLHGIKMGTRRPAWTATSYDFVYESACAVCMRKNAGECLGLKKKPVLLMNMKTNELFVYKERETGTTASWKIKNDEYVWCVEWCHCV